jgi:hypothetical protein
LARQASKGLKLSCESSPIERTGYLSFQTDAFIGEEGDHTLKALEGKNITANFNPLGIFLRRWQIDNIETPYAVAELQKTEFKPSPPPKPRPWYLFLLPNRIYLSRITCDSGNVTWKFKGQKSGIYGLRVIITPDGRDFSYEATGGRLRMPKVPLLKVKHLHTLIRKPRLYLYDATFTDDNDEGLLSFQGEAGLQEDRTITTHVEISQMPARSWIPEKWRSKFEGFVNGTVDWTSNGTKLEGAGAKGTLSFRKARLHELPALEKIAKLTGKDSLNDLVMDELKIPFVFENKKFSTTDLQVESKGIFRLEGNISVHEKKLAGKCNFGISRTYLEWLPEPEKVFTEEHGGYLWTEIHLSGTVDKPEEDLSQRIKDAIFDSPGTFFSFLFNQIGNWFGDVME